MRLAGGRSSGSDTLPWNQGLPVSLPSPIGPVGAWWRTGRCVLTAAGPHRICTGFPFPPAGRLLYHAVYVAVAGASVAGERVAALAERVGELLAGRGCVVVTGGLGGVMEAASRGAHTAGGQVLAILPGESRDEATAHADLVVATGTGQARNLALAATCDALIAVGGEWGTLSEIALARKLGRPVVTLAGWELPGIPSAESPESAVALVVQSGA